MSPRRAKFKTMTSTREWWTIPVVSVLVGVLAVSSGGLEPWLAGCVTVAVFVGLLGVSFVKKRMAAADTRVRQAIRMQEDNRCKRCDADLWGLDVSRKGRDYVVKCGECGAETVVAKPRVGKGKRAKPEPISDRGPFKFPG